MLFYSKICELEQRQKIDEYILHAFYIRIKEHITITKTIRRDNI